MPLRTLLIRGVLIGGIVAMVNFPASTAGRRAPKPAPAKTADASRQTPAQAPAADARPATKTPPPVH